jgi:hypothetical protein
MPFDQKLWPSLREAATLDADSSAALEAARSRLIKLRRIKTAAKAAVKAAEKAAAKVAAAVALQAVVRGRRVRRSIAAAKAKVAKKVATMISLVAFTACRRVLGRARKLDLQIAKGREKRAAINAKKKAHRHAKLAATAQVIKYAAARIAAAACRAVVVTVAEQRSVVTQQAAASHSDSSTVGNARSPAPVPVKSAWWSMGPRRDIKQSARAAVRLQAAHRGHRYIINCICFGRHICRDPLAH